MSNWKVEIEVASSEQADVIIDLMEKSIGKVEYESIGVKGDSGFSADETVQDYFDRILEPEAEEAEASFTPRSDADNCFEAPQFVESSIGMKCVEIIDGTFILTEAVMAASDGQAWDCRDQINAACFEACDILCCGA